MPIPFYDRRVANPGNLRLVRPQARPVGGGGAGLLALGSSLQGLGQTIGNVLEDDRQRAERQREELAAVSVNESLMASRSRLIDEIPKRQAAAPESGEGYAAGILEDFDKDAEERLKSAPTQLSRQFLKERLDATRLTLQQESLAFETRKGNEYKQAGILRSTDGARTAAQFRPDQFTTLLGEQRAIIANSGLPASAQSQLLEDAAFKLASASVLGMINQDARKTLSELGNEKTKNPAIRSLSFDQRQDLTRAAESEVRRLDAEAKARQAEQRAVLSERVRDASAAYRLGLQFDNPPSRAEFTAALGAADGIKAFEGFQREKQLGADLSALAVMSPEEQTKLLEQRAPKGTEGAADAAQRYSVLVSRAQDLRRQLNTDPAAYVARYSPRLAESLKQADESPEAAREYATASIAEQQRLGVARPRVLTESAASSIAQSFNTNPEQPEAVANLIAAEQQKWGSYWAQVYGELAAKKLPAAALAIGRGMAPGAATRLSSVAAIDLEELRKGVDTPPKDVREKLAGSMEDLRLSLDGVAGGTQNFAAMYDAAERLTYSYLRQGKKVSDATEQAYREVIGDHYQFTEINGRKLRVPAQYDIDAVEEEARRSLITIKPGDLQQVIPTSTSNADAAQRDLLRAITKQGYFVTSGTQEDAVTLFLNGRPVLTKDGAPYSISFDQLQTAKAARIKEMGDRYTDALGTTEPFGYGGF